MRVTLQNFHKHETSVCFSNSPLSHSITSWCIYVKFLKFVTRINTRKYKPFIHVRLLLLLHVNFILVSVFFISLCKKVGCSGSFYWYSIKSTEKKNSNKNMIFSTAPHLFIDNKTVLSFVPLEYSATIHFSRSYFFLLLNLGCY